MKEIIFGILPGAIFLYRYAPKFELSKIVGLLLMEMVPYLIICFFQDINVTYVLIGFITIYSIYEFGYIENDLSSVKHEIEGKTIRIQFKNFKIIYFILARTLIIFIIFFYFIEYLNSYKILIPLSLIPIIFSIHNRIVNVRHRVVTFLLLNNLKIIVRLLILSSTSIIYFISFIPHIFTKMLHYILVKELALMNEDYFNKTKLGFYIGFLLSFIFIDIKLSIVMTPLMLNHNKKYIYQLVKKS